jgi:DNA-binding response OmpR family regulator
MSSVSIFIIEADLELAETVAEGMSELGFSVRTETSPRGALGWLLDSRNPCPDVVVLDMPPPIAGLRWFFDEARSNRRTAGIPIIATASAMGLPAEIARAGAHFVGKPYSIRTLQETIELVLRRNLETSPAPE